MKSIAIHQPNYLPWPGYFLKMMLVDKFVFLDDVKFSKGSYTNRAKFSFDSFDSMLTLAVSRNAHHKLIGDIEIAQANWQNRHIRFLSAWLSSTSYFVDIEPILEELTRLRENNIVSVNARLIAVIAKMLAFEIEPAFSSNHSSALRGSDRIAKLVQLYDGDYYVSGLGFNNYVSKPTWPASLPYVTIDFSKYILNSSILSTNSIVQSIAAFGKDAIRDELERMKMEIKQHVQF